MEKKLKRICIVTSSELTLKVFLAAQVRKIQQSYEVTIVVNTDNSKLLEELGIRAELKPVSIQRQISFISDLKALCILIQFFQTQKFDLVHSISPKAGLLTMLAGFLTRVPSRIHTFTGQVWVTKKGVSRWMLKFFDKVISFCATHLLADSLSQREFLLKNNIVSFHKSYVLGKGSICGVDINKFSPNSSVRNSLRQNFNIDNNAIVFLFIGRINHDKGILDLHKAFVRNLINDEKDIHLLLVGPDEENLMPQIFHESESIISASSKLHYVGYTDTPEQYMATADILCLPSYREGFGNVIIEAASVGLPALASRIYGITDAVVDGETGLLHEAGNIQDITDKMSFLLNNFELRQSLAKQACLRARQDFDQTKIIQALISFYEAVLS
ncbi:glycosyltransferase [Spirulina major CS-329]|uniref:glycosyltransferase n=1 Tax=Spirulina TaxID=1154 RepID=UPI00232B94F1|nr:MULTISPECIES: glycosyltransferase [Spirulina]MDB9494345.1 glycosyltransferase [Spirulina subsalsa CS-330]MDB9502335.1 glycosyltransferase [Spirulina major CS-329]